MRHAALTAILTIVAATGVGCSHTSTTDATSTSGTSAASSAPAAVGPVLDVTIAAGKASPVNAALSARTGQPITVHVTSDAADELHVHSTPDHEFVIAAAPDQTITFTVDEPGKVAVELHHLDQTVATVDVTP